MSGVIQAALLVCIYLDMSPGVVGTSMKSPFTCQAGHVVAGQRASVTCHFDPDLYDSNYHLIIVRYPLKTSTDVTGRDVLRCYPEGGKPICDVDNGFTFDGVVKEDITVTIPNVTCDLEGRYACQLIPAKGRKKEFCELTVSAQPPDCHCPETGTNQVPLLLAIILGLLFFASVMVNVVLYRSKRQMNGDRRFRETDGTDFSTAAGSQGERLLADGTKRDHNGDVNSNTKRQSSLIIPRIMPYNEMNEEEEEHRDIPRPSRWNSIRLPYRRPYNVPIRG